MIARFAIAAMALIAIVGVAENDILQESRIGADDYRVDPIFEEQDSLDEMVQASKSQIITNNYVWKDDGCACKSALIAPVCADGASFHNECEARCKGHHSWKEGVCPTVHHKKVTVVKRTGPAIKVATTKKLSAKCKQNLKNMQKWAKAEILQAHLKAEQAKRHKEHAKYDKSKCDQHVAGIAMVGQHKHYNYCALADKYKALAVKVAKEGHAHALKAEQWQTRFRKKQCFKSQWKTNDVVGDRKWGGHGKRISLVWSANYEKRYSMRWPHCYNIGCFHDPTPRNVIEHKCDNIENCSGFSFSADKRLGTGCLKQCFHDDSFAGYGAITNDYWVKREIKHIQIYASHHGVMLYSGCFHNGEQTMSWTGHSKLVTDPHTKHKSMFTTGIHKKELAGASVPKGWCLQIWNQKGFKGKKLSIPGPRNVACFQNYRMQGKTSWQKKAQSIKIFKHNGHNCGQPKKVHRRSKKAKKKKMINYRQVPSEYSAWWKRKEDKHPFLTHLHKNKYKQSHYWRKNAISKVIGKLAKLRHKSLQCDFGDPGCTEFSDLLDSDDMPKIERLPRIEDAPGQAKSHEEDPRRESAPKHAPQPAPKAKKPVHAAKKNYMTVLLHSIFREQSPKVQKKFKDAETWCLNAHNKCRESLHIRLMAKKHLAMPTELIEEDPELTALKQEVATSVMKARQAVEQHKATKKKQTKENLNKYAQQE